MYRREQIGKIWPFILALLTLTIIVAGLWYFQVRMSAPRGSSSTSTMPASQNNLSSKILLAREMAEFASRRAEKNRMDAKLKSQQQMIDHLERFSQYSPITGSGIQEKYDKQNAIIRNEANQIGIGIELLKDTHALLVTAEEVRSSADVSSAEVTLDKAISDTLLAFKKSPIVSQSERLEFEQKHLRLR